MKTIHRSRRKALMMRAAAPALALALVAGGAGAQEVKRAFEIAPQPLADALLQLSTQADIDIVAAAELTRGRTAPRVSGELTTAEAMNLLLAGSGLAAQPSGGGYVLAKVDSDPQSEGAAGGGADGTVEALIVTAQKREEDIQDVPIAISAFSQEDLTRSQVAGGPDLMTQVPNFTFTKTNFSSYSIQIRGIGTQAISATVDPAVAVAFNNTPFVRNRFFEQEFYDLQRVEVLRGPQGTLYGRNATAGVVNIISAKPSFRHEAKLSGDIANYNSTRLEGMINIPLVEDIAALRIAGAWTKRDGYTTNEITGNPIDGRDLWSTRVSLRIEPTDSIRANLIWEHFEEDDDRLRSGKQLCKKHVPRDIGGILVNQDGSLAGSEASTFSQGCEPVSLYSPEAFQTPNGFALPYYGPLMQLGLGVFAERDPYASQTQSRDLRVIESTRDPEYRAKTDIAELQLEFDISPTLLLASETAFAADELFSTQDFNRFNTRPGAFHPTSNRDALQSGVFCDPQLGCSDRLVLADLSTAESRHFSQELRLSSDYDGRFNFNLGANFLRYDTEDKYYVFINSLSLWSIANAPGWENGTEIYEVIDDLYVPGVTDNRECLRRRLPGDPNESAFIVGCIYVDPNPIGSLNDLGHNYFLSKNPYRLISYAVFGEAYYNVTDNLKVTAGLRWTTDKKRAPRIPSWLLAAGSIGYPVMEVVEQDWKEPTGRVTVDWKPDLGFSDETLLYASYAHGYKAGGMNPPPAVISLYGDVPGLRESIIQPKTFEAEFIDAFEIGSKNTLLDGRVTLNVAGFYYDYTGYQLSQIVNRSAVTQNFDAEIWGLEIEADWRPLENLRLGFKGGYENTRVGDGMQAIDLMDRTAGDPNWVVMRPFPTIPSNCILPLWLVTWGGRLNVPAAANGQIGPCAHAYYGNLDPVTLRPYEPDPVFDASGNEIASYGWAGYPGFNPATAPNNGEGIFKDLSGNELPNAPNYTATLTADYTLPLPNDWLATLHTDLYYQSEAWTRIFNTEGYDKLKAYTNVNLAAIFTNEEAGWNVMAYVKNVFDRDSITGAFLNSDDTGLTTNVFLTEPRLFGLRVSKSWTGEPIFGGLIDASSKGPFPLTVEIGGQVQRHDAPQAPFHPEMADSFSDALSPLDRQGLDLDWGDGREVKLTYRPRAPWSMSLAARYGRTNGKSRGEFARENATGGWTGPEGVGYYFDPYEVLGKYNYVQTTDEGREEHTLVDFSIGRDVGLGLLGEGRSTVSAGLRFARLESSSHARLEGIPDNYAPLEFVLKYGHHFHHYDAHLWTDRTFEGAGPMLSWDVSKALMGNDTTGQLLLDWSLAGGVLFGDNKARLLEEVEANYVYQNPFGDRFSTRTITSVPFARSESVSVPNLNASLGLSYSVHRLKIGAGYRWERFYDAIDGGYRDAMEQDRTIDGPYFKLSVGFGG